MFSFIKKLTDYTPKNFKGKTTKEILAMNSSKVPDNWFTDDYTQEHLKAFIDADLSEEQENAIDLLIDLKQKGEIIRKCYDKRKKRSQTQQAPMEQQAPMPVPQTQAAQTQAAQTQAVQTQAPTQQAPTEQEYSDDSEDEEEEEETSTPPQDAKPLLTGGGRKGTKRTKHTKRTKRTKHSGGKKHKRSGHKRTKRKHKKSKHVRFTIN
jgi:hypothetical protein